jgi:hypothetical protein
MFAKVLLLLATLIIVGTVGFLAGEYRGERSVTVCSAPTEDSTLTGCDYRNGPEGKGWYKK